MMTLSMMQQVVSTVNDEWESPLADEILSHWKHDSGPAKFWRASANFVFFFKKAGQDHVLRFNHESERTAEAIQAEIDYANELARMDLTSKGIQVARAIPSLSGNFVESVATEYGTFHAAVFEALPGEHGELDEFTPEQFSTWGKALGELHHATTQITTAQSSTDQISRAQTIATARSTWEEHLAWAAEILPAEEEAPLQALEMMKRELSQLPINEHNFGLIHYDFELDNVIWDGGQAGIIDFDDCAFYWFVADIALALGDLFEEGTNEVDLPNESFLHFIQGYRSARPIPDEELSLIPLFLRVGHMLDFAKLYHAMTPINPDGELPWMAGLRDKLTAKMGTFRDEFSSEAYIAS